MTTHKRPHEENIAADARSMPPPPPMSKRPRLRPPTVGDETEESSAAESAMRQRNTTSMSSARPIQHIQTPSALRSNRGSEGSYRPGRGDDDDDITSSSSSFQSSPALSGSLPRERMQNGAVRSRVSGGGNDDGSERSSVDRLVQQALRDQQANNNATNQRPASALTVGAQSRAITAPSAAAAPAVAGGAVRPPLPVARPSAAMPDQCPVCFEQFHLQYEMLKQSQDATAAANSKTSEGVRGEKVKSAIMRRTSDRYKMLFRTECVLRGQIPDEILLPLLLDMHKHLIERVLVKYPRIKFVPWTLRILQNHFNINNGHIFDPIRETASDLKDTRKAIDDVKTRLKVPDPDNPAQMIIDHRAVMSFERLSKRKEALVTKIIELHKSKEENLTDAIFTLVTEIARCNEGGSNTMGALQIMTNPRMAAGTTAVGGDTMRSSGKQASIATGTAFDFYAISGY